MGLHIRTVLLLACLTAGLLVALLPESCFTYPARPRSRRPWQGWVRRRPLFVGKRRPEVATDPDTSSLRDGYPGINPDIGSYSAQPQFSCLSDADCPEERCCLRTATDAQVCSPRPRMLDSCTIGGGWSDHERPDSTAAGSCSCTTGMACVPLDQGAICLPSR